MEIYGSVKKHVNNVIFSEFKLKDGRRNMKWMNFIY